MNKSIFVNFFDSKFSIKNKIIQSIKVAVTIGEKHTQRKSNLNFFVGIFKAFFNINSARVEFRNIIEGNFYYENSLLFETVSYGKWTMSESVAKIILENKNHFPDKLDILDIACHHGKLLQALNTFKGNRSLIVNSYTGVDKYESAIVEAKKLFPEHGFFVEDALFKSTYEKIPNESKNLITCLGFIENFCTPNDITFLLKQFSLKLKKENISAVFISYCTSKLTYGIENKKEIDLKGKNVELKSQNEVNYFLSTRKNFPAEFYYSPEVVRSIVEKCGFIIDTNLSKSRPSFFSEVPSCDILCLRWGN